MAETLEIIRYPLHGSFPDARPVALPVERGTLAKRRWRGTAEDGREFGFDLETPLINGALFHASADTAYFITQAPEPVLEIAFAEATPQRAAELGWRLGNLHFPLQITDAAIRVPDDSAIRQMLERENVLFQVISAVFTPLKGGGHHH